MLQPPALSPCRVQLLSLAEDRRGFVSAAVEGVLAVPLALI